MSHRFPPIAPQDDRSQPKARARSLTALQAPSLPWFELCLGFALLLVLRGV